ncbi:MAG: HIRAN domain-containing protein [Verrucomicrobia bacterium]|nr:HIRAN domain-containing protein [Verrucomicrobiota bacterium]
MNSEIGITSRRAFLGFLAKAPLVPVAVLAPRPAQAAPPTSARQVLMNDFAIAGFRYYDGARELPGLAAGTKLTLRAEPANPYDSFAVEIFHGPAKLGYVPRFCNRHISRLLQDAVPLACVVERVDSQAPPWEAVVVGVCLPVI